MPHDYCICCSGTQQPAQTTVVCWSVWHQGLWRGRLRLLERTPVILAKNDLDCGKFQRSRFLATINIPDVFSKSSLPASGPALQIINSSFSLSRIVSRLHPFPLSPLRALSSAIMDGIRFILEDPQAANSRQKKRSRLVTACDTWYVLTRCMHFHFHPADPLSALPEIPSVVQRR